MRRLLRLLSCAPAVALCLLGLPTPANATMVVLDDLPTMVHTAHIVVHGKVISQKELMEDGRVVTLSQVEVLDAIKGSAQGDVLTVYQVGGTAEGQSLHISGAHTHVVGEEMVLFAMHHGDRVVSYGVGTGKFRIERNSVDGVVREDLDELVVVGQPGRQRGPRHAPSVVEFKAHLRDLLLQQKPDTRRASGVNLDVKRLRQPLRKPARTLKTLPSMVTPRLHDDVRRLQEGGAQ